MYSNIPEVSFNINDTGHLVPVLAVAPTTAVLIIGTAIDGPMNEPKPVDSRSIEQIFGPVVYDKNYYHGGDRVNNEGKDSGNDLVRAFAEVSMGGCSNIWAMRVGDSTLAVAATATQGSASTTYSNLGIYEPATAGLKTLATRLGINVEAKNPGYVYNGLPIDLNVIFTAASGVDSATITLNQKAIGKGRSLTYTLKASGKDALTQREFLNLLANDTRNTVLTGSPVDEANLDVAITNAMVATTEYVAAATGSIYKYTLRAGTDGVKKDHTLTQMYQVLTGDTTNLDVGEVFAEDSPFSLLETVQAGIIYLSCLRADENVGTQALPNTVMVDFAKAMYYATQNDYPCVGVIGMTPLNYPGSQANVNTRIDELLLERDETDADGGLAANSDYSRVKVGYWVSMDSATGNTGFHYTDPITGVRVDLGGYLLLVGGPEVTIPSKYGGYSGTYAGILAGQLSAASPTTTAVNLPLVGATNMNYQLTNRQLNKLCGGQPWDATTGYSGKGGSYVILRRNSSGRAAVSLDNTCAARTSDFATYQVRSVVNTIAQGAKDVGTQFIGKVNTTPTLLALRTQLKGFLESMYQNGLLAGGEGTGYKFRIDMSPNDAIVGKLNIILEVRPSAVIRFITVDITVLPPTSPGNA